MRIYKKETEPIIKIDITQQGVSREFIKVCDTEFDTALSFLQSLASKYGSAVKNGRSTSVRIRQYISGVPQKGFDKHFSFYGLSPRDFREIIVESLENKEHE